jgi:hypothetical protein
LDEMADLAERHGAWLHVDGAFGLFAAVSPRTAGLVRGVERADSVAADGHKWLNVPYESGEEATASNCWPRSTCLSSASVASVVRELGTRLR